MFIHHVFFWLKNPANDADLQQLKQGLEQLKSIPDIRMVHIGVPADTNRPVIERSYSMSWLLVFDTAAAQDVYQDHPIHHKFVADCSHLWERVVVYDSVEG
jgi:hypothetical protein